MQVLAKVLAIDPDASYTHLPAIFAARRFETILGGIAIDPRTQHATLPVEIGRIASGNSFEVISRAEGVAPDPYLSHYDRAATFAHPRLKVVS